MISDNEINKEFLNGVREFAEWCENYNVKFDEYGFRTAEMTIKEFLEWRNEN